MKLSFSSKNKLMWLCLATASALIGCNAEQKQQNTENAVTTDTANANSPVRMTAQDLPNYLTRSVQDDVFYFVMPDRFANGDPSNDNGSSTIAVSSGGFDPSNKGMYHGGDIKGLEQKLPYLADLGVSAIWMTPILRNKAIQGEDGGYHGYWVLDFTQIDPHLGTNEDLKQFIDKAHQANIKVFFDIITNHTADVIKYQECHGEAGDQWLVEGNNGCPYISLEEVANGKSYNLVIPAGEENIKVPAWLNDPKYYHNQGDTTFEGENSVYGDFAGLDDINTDDPAVVQLMIDTFKQLITEFKPDGFRIDTVKHVNIEFWQSFAPALVDHAKQIGIPEFFMFGEVYSPDSKVLSQYTTTGKMQSVLDFGFQQAVHQVLVEEKSPKAIANWLDRDVDYLDEDSNANQLLNFTGNHDMGRFAHMLMKTENFSPEQALQRVDIAHAMMYFLRGMPIIYYGDEQGFTGDGHDKDSRQDMMPSKVASYNDDVLLGTNKTTADDNFDTNHPLYQQLANYADVYYRHSALRNGQQHTLFADEQSGIYAASRINDEQSLIVIFNTAVENRVQSIALNNEVSKLVPAYQSNTKATFDVAGKNTVEVSMPPLSAMVLIIDTK
ncbi:alpha-amylase family glycosyl hydrolase [Thalassotalea fusca]